MRVAVLRRKLSSRLQFAGSVIRYRDVVIAACILLAIAAPELADELPALGTRTSPSSGIPLGLDDYLVGVRQATAPRAHILVAGDPPVAVFFRASFLLYPRTVDAYQLNAVPGARAPSSSVAWKDLEKRAHEVRAQYVAVFSLYVTGVGDKPQQVIDETGELMKVES